MSMNTAKAEVERRARHLADAICYLENESDAALNDLLRYCQSLTTTNCGWTQYELAPLLMKEIRSIMSIREAHADHLLKSRGIAPNTGEKP